jgi:hypothetical protein
VTGTVSAGKWTFLAWVAQCLVVACSTAPKPAPTAPASPAAIALADVNVVSTAAGEVVPHQTIIISGDRIGAIGPVGDVVVPPGAVSVHGDGTAFVMPGLADMHVHLVPDQPDWLALFLLHGVTTVLELNASEAHLQLRDRLAAGDVLGPTMYATGRLVEAPHVATPAGTVRRSKSMFAANSRSSSGARHARARQSEINVHEIDGGPRSCCLSPILFALNLPVAPPGSAQSASPGGVRSLWRGCRRPRTAARLGKDVS